jgi:DNA-directed RNA polymerase specialized sigma24 family protein
MGSGDDQAARMIWERYSPRLTTLARQRLPVWLRRIVDGGDLANSVFGDFLLGLRQGRFPDLGDRDDLWALLACMTARKAINEIERALRQRRPPPWMHEPITDALVATEPEPDIAVMAAEQFERLLERLRLKDKILESIAIWKLEGYTHQEIAGRLGCSCRRVARKLELIRMTWETEGLR